MYFPSFGIGTPHARKHDTGSKKREGHKYHVTDQVLPYFQEHIYWRVFTNKFYFWGPIIYFG
jgi:hypothetical protein